MPAAFTLRLDDGARRRRPCYHSGMPVSRRLAAILAADVVGYSRMMGEDEAGTAATVRESRDAAGAILSGQGGRIFKTMGDGFLVEFRSVVSAVASALAVQAETARCAERQPVSRRSRRVSRRARTARLMRPRDACGARTSRASSAEKL